MIKFYIEKNVQDSMITAARQAAPLEACGLCGGQADRATCFYQLNNAEASNEHYSMLPEEQFAAIRDMRSHGVDLVAIWHSHPETAARMSEEDLRLAFTPNIVYLVLSLLTPDNPDIRGFAVEDGKAVPIELHFVDDNHKKDEDNRISNEIRIP